MRTVTMDSRHRITLGKALCQKLGIRPGQKLSFAVVGGIVEVIPADSRNGLKLAPPDIDRGNSDDRDARRGA